MRRPSTAAGFARVADGVDLADHALSFPLADELVSRNASEWVIAASQLDVGVADAGCDHAHQRLARRWRGARHVVAQAKLPVLEPQCAQAVYHLRNGRRAQFASALPRPP